MAKIKLTTNTKRAIKWTAVTALGALIVLLVTDLHSGVSSIFTKPTGLPIQTNASVKPTIISNTLISYAFPGEISINESELKHLDELGGKDKRPELSQDWFNQKNAVNIDGVDIDLDLRSRRDSNIIVKDIVPVTDCKEPLTGTLFYSPNQGGGLNMVTTLYYDLDDANKRPSFAVWEEGKQISKGDDYFAENIITIEPSKSATVKIHASTLEHYCSFSFIATVIDKSEKIEVPINNNGKPFEATALNNDFSSYKALYLKLMGVPQKKWPKDSNGYPTPPNEWQRYDPATLGD